MPSSTTGVVTRFSIGDATLKPAARKAVITDEKYMIEMFVQYQTVGELSVRGKTVWSAECRTQAMGDSFICTK